MATNEIHLAGHPFGGLQTCERCGVHLVDVRNALGVDQAGAHFFTPGAAILEGAGSFGLAGEHPGDAAPTCVSAAERAAAEPGAMPGLPPDPGVVAIVAALLALRDAVIVTGRRIQGDHDVDTDAPGTFIDEAKGLVRSAR